jgi:sugar lactone lactonase YvrE
MFSATNFEPRGIALDSAGAFLYVADNNRHTIRKVDTTTGANTTVFGNSGNGGSTGDGTPAGTASRARNPRAVWVDASGNIYFADTLNNRIRRINATTGIVTTVAGRGPNNTSVTLAAGAGNTSRPGSEAGDGGRATQAALANPEGLVGDNKGNIYIADTNFNRIRRVDKNGTITTVAGLGTQGAAFLDGMDAASVTFNRPTGLGMGTDGNLYIADSGNNRIRQLNLTTNVVRTVAGGGTTANDNVQGAQAILNGPTGVSFDAAGNMLIADQNNAKVRGVDVATGLITTVAGTAPGRGDNGPATLATLGYPKGIAIGTDGAIYIGDTNSSKVRKIDPTTGIITSVLGTGVSGNTADPVALR